MGGKNKVFWLFMLIAIGCFFAGGYLANYHAASDVPAIVSPKLAVDRVVLDQPVANFQLLDVTGQLRDFAEWQGAVVVINFWATWCAPCLQEIPEFVSLQEQYGEQGVQFVGITVDSVAEVSVFADQLGVNYPLLVGGVEVISLAESLGNSFGYLPYTVVVDRNGVVRFIKRGRLLLTEAEAEISRWL